MRQNKLNRRRQANSRRRKPRTLERLERRDLLAADPADLFAGQTTSQSPLEERLAVHVSRVPGDAAVAVLNITTGDESRVNENVVASTASTIKAGILYAALRYVDATPGVMPNSPLALPDGTTSTIAAAAQNMIAVSSNLDTNAIIDLLGFDYINDEFDDLGLTDTRLRRYMRGVPNGAGANPTQDYQNGIDNESTAAEMATLLQTVHLNEGFLLQPTNYGFFWQTMGLDGNGGVNTKGRTDNFFNQGIYPENNTAVGPEWTDIIEMANKPGSNSWTGTVAAGHNPAIGNHSTGSDAGRLRMTGTGDIIIYAVFTDNVTNATAANRAISCIGYEIAVEYAGAEATYTPGNCQLDDGRVLTVNGTDAADEQAIAPTPGDVDDIDVTVNGQIVGSIDTVTSTSGPPLLDSIYVFGHGGGDQIDIAALPPTSSIDTFVYGGRGGDDIELDAEAFVHGGRGNDTIDSGLGPDLIEGFSGDDTITAGPDDDIVRGGRGNDVIDGEAGNDTLAGNRGNDLLIGGSGDDSIEGNQGDDEIVGGSLGRSAPPETGDDVIRGGGGDDRIIGDSGVLFPFPSESTLGGDDTILAGPGSDMVFGQEGDDRIEGNEDGDTLFGGAGGDSIVGGSRYIIGQTFRSDGRDVIRGGDDSDVIHGDNLVLGLAPQISDAGTGDVIFGNDGSDLIYAQSGNDVVDGDAGNDTIDAGVGNDEVVGDSGDDVIYGGVGNDLLIGQAGHDVIAGQQGGDTLVGGFYSPNPNSNPDIGNDILVGGDGNDVLLGDSGHLPLVLGDNTGGDDQLSGGSGDDLLFGQVGNDDLLGGRGDDVLVGGAGDDSAAGGLGSDLISGQSGRDDLSGDRGDDVINGGPDADTLSGGSGNDTISGGSGEDIINGNAGNDFLGGNSGDDFVRGGSGDDVANGGDGNDRVAGGRGNDVLAGGRGADHLQGGNGHDFIVGGVFDSTGVAAVDTAPDQLGGGRGNDILIGDGFSLVAPFDPSATGGPDLINGDAGDDLIVGQGGDDTISGGNGNDAISGGPGDDNLSGEAGQDIISGDQDDDRIRGGADDDQLNGGSENDLVLGGSGDDVVLGGDGRDILLGGRGADRLVGGNGDDILVHGPTVHDDHDLALQSLMQEWSSAKPYATRRANLAAIPNDGFATRLNGNFFLRSGIDVQTDSAEDNLSGSPDRDWFLAEQPGDIVADLMPGENVN